AFGVNPDDAGRIDEWIESVGRRWSHSPRAIFGTRLCVAELAANVIEHGVAKSDRDHIIVTLTRCDDCIAVEFMDSRERFDPTGPVTTKRPDTLESATINGRGLMLVHAYAKELSYHYNGIYNRTTFNVESC